MNEHVANNIRNIALVGHGGSGKTTLVEAALRTIGKTTRMGSISDGNTVSDYLPEEQERQYSLNTTLMQIEHGSVKLNILDTPGYTDFIGEPMGALRSADNAVFVVNAQTGVEVGTELMWRNADKYSMPRMIIINACSREHADFDAALEQCKDRFGGSGNSVVLLQYPVNPGEGFNQIMDGLSGKNLSYEPAGDGQGSEVASTDDLAAIREELTESVAETDEELLEAYLEAGELEDSALIEGLRKAVISGMIIPVLCSDAQHNVGVDRVLDHMELLLAAPTDMPPVEAQVDGGDGTMMVTADEDEPVAAFVFKSISEAHVGELSFVRVYSGKIEQGVDLTNTKQNSTERVGQSFFLIGKDRTEAGHIGAGDMGALVKLKSTHTGDTLCASARKILLPEVEWPLPSITHAIVPRSKGDEEKIGGGLHRIHEEDPTFIHTVDGELGQTLISGQGELHLDVAVKRLHARFGVEVDTLKPKIPYRETIRKKAEGQYRHKKQSGGRGQFGDVSLRIEPQKRGEGYEFSNEIVGGVIPGKFIPAVEKGINEALVSGIIVGTKVVDVKAALFFGSFHPVDSSEIAFKIAGMNAFRQAMGKASPVLLEPIDIIEVTVPDEFMGDVMGDLSGRRGKIQGMDAKGPFQIIRAQVPVASLYRYSTDLRSMTGGRGFFKRDFSHYEEVPSDVQAKIVEEVQAEKDAEE
jgi:elongation factor G